MPARLCLDVNRGVKMRQLLRRLLTDDGGQDLIEYALLTTAVGFAVILAFNLIQTAIGTTYGSWTNDAGSVNSIWESPAPGAGS